MAGTQEIIRLGDHFSTTLSGVGWWRDTVTVVVDRIVDDLIYVKVTDITAYEDRSDPDMRGKSIKIGHGWGEPVSTFLDGYTRI